MRISDKYFNQLNPSYQKVIKELEQKLEKYEGDEAKSVEVMLDFSTMYLMPSEYWDDIGEVFDNEEKLKQNVLKAYYHCYFDYFYLENPKNKAYSLHKTLNFAADWKMDDPVEDYNPNKSDLSFPHSHLNKVFYKIESESNRPLSKELFAVYEMNKRYYEKIRAAKNDVDHWFKLLCEAADANNDEDFIRHNVEYRLGSNLLNTKLWKLYIEYLREHDPAEMIQVYSKYCRFFLDDVEMKEKYKQEVEKYGPVYVPWKNLFDFESKKVGGGKEKIEVKGEELDKNETGNEQSNEDESDSHESESEAANLEGPSAPKRFKPSHAEEEDQICNSEPADTVICASKSIDISALCKNFYDTFKPQNFSFKKPIMSYILENANTTVLKKLHQSCKYFFDRSQTPNCHRLLCSYEKTQFCEESLEFTYKTNDVVLNGLLKDTIITTTFDASSISSDLFSSVISKLHRCDAKYIFIRCSITADEMKFLLESRNAIIFHWWSSEDNTNVTKLEEITQYLPKIEDLDIISVEVTSQTFAKLLNQEFLSKIYSLTLREIQGEAFNVDDFLDYCKQYRAEYFKLNMEFEENFPDRDTFVTHINARVESEIDQKNADIYID